MIQYIGPLNQPKCPKCGNGMQNAVPQGSPMHRRCATCKHVWELAQYVVLEGSYKSRFYTTHKGETEFRYENTDYVGDGLSGVYTIVAYVDTCEEAERVIGFRF